MHASNQNTDTPRVYCIIFPKAIFHRLPLYFLVMEETGRTIESRRRIAEQLQCSPARTKQQVQVQLKQLAELRRRQQQRQKLAASRRKQEVEKAQDEKMFGKLVREAQEEGAEPYQKKCLWILNELMEFRKRVRDGDLSEATQTRVFALVEEMDKYRKFALGINTREEQVAYNKHDNISKLGCDLYSAKKGKVEESVPSKICWDAKLIEYRRYAKTVTDAPPYVAICDRDIDRYGYQTCQNWLVEQRRLAATARSARSETPPCSSTTPAHAAPCAPVTSSSSMLAAEKKGKDGEFAVQDGFATAFEESIKDSQLTYEFPP